MFVIQLFVFMVYFRSVQLAFEIVCVNNLVVINISFVFFEFCNFMVNKFVQFFNVDLGFVFVYIIVEIIDMVEVIFIVKNVNFNEWYFVGICYLLLKCFIFF